MTNRINRIDTENELRMLIYLNLIHNNPMLSDDYDYESLTDIIMKNIPESILNSYLPHIENPDPLSPFIENLVIMTIIKTKCKITGI